MNFLNLFLSLLFPRRCLRCGKLGKYFCKACDSEIVKLIRTDTICPICTRPAVGGETHPYCHTRYSLDGLIAPFQYRGAIGKAVKQLKYQRVTDLSDELSLLSFNTITHYRNNSFLRSFMQKEQPTLIPIPLHALRKHTRWFNQSEVVGKRLSQLLSLPFEPTILLRIKSVKPQAELKREDRLKNVKGIFTINPSYHFTNSSFILFDDVWTTGSTIREAANVLKHAGAHSVWALTIAR